MASRLINSPLDQVGTCFDNFGFIKRRRRRRRRDEVTSRYLSGFMEYCTYSTLVKRAFVVLVVRLLVWCLFVRDGYGWMDGWRW